MLIRYDIVNDASLRNQLELQIANIYNGATTGNATWDNLATSLKSVILSYLGQQIGISSATIVIIWANGSRTELKVEAGSTHEAKYQAGQSRDSEGNRIPDAAATNDNTGADYAGDYSFNDVNALEDWIQAAIRYGIPVTGGGSGTQGGMSCTWDGQTLTCIFVIY